MKLVRRAVLASLLLASSPLFAHTAEPDPAMSEPDRVSWELFVEVTATASGAGKDILVFETWASNEDTFKDAPQFPSVPSPKVLNFPALQGKPPPPTGEWRHIPPGGEEVRRNKPSFDYITDEKNRFHTRTGLANAFAEGRKISLPVDAIEVKANWIPAEKVDSAKYYVNVGSDGRPYALVSLHITTKLIPNWTWATFEHADNKGRCDYIGCHDEFGAEAPSVPPNAAPGETYPACAKTPKLLAMMAGAKLPPVLQNYCLKGSQTEYVSATGLPTLLGNSVTEHGFDNTASCMTCHARASVNAAGASAQGYGFLLPPDRNDANCPTPGRCSPNGPPNPAWFWNNPGASDQELKSLQTDFLFSLPLHAIP